MNAELTSKVNTFISKAQIKIAELGTWIVNYGDDRDKYNLIFDLSSFLESLDSMYNHWEDDDVEKYVDYFNSVADLNRIPYFEMPVIRIVTGTSTVSGGGISGPLYSTDILDFEQAVTIATNGLAHNSLSGIQGGSSSARYHMSASERTYLRNLINPYVAPVVAIELIATPALSTGDIAEKGTTVTEVILQGTPTLNSGDSQTSAKYYRDGVQIGDTLEPPSDLANQHTESNAVTSDTAFAYEGTFSNGGVKTATKVIRFIAPTYSGLFEAAASAEDVQAGDKSVIEKPDADSNLSITYVINTGNIDEDDPETPYLLHPADWGIADYVYLSFEGGFDIKDDFEITEVTVTLADASEEQYYLYEYTNITEGTYKFIFKWLE